MIRKKLPTTLVMAMALSAGLYGCSGGGGSASSAPGMTIGGTVAAGAAFEAATLYVFDSRGVQVGTTSAIDPATGAYSLTLQADAVAPMVVVATRTNSDGQAETMVSVIGTATQTTANVTPITSLLAALLSPSGDPTKLLDELKAGTATITADSITAAIAEVNRILASVITATGTSGSDPLTTTFAADGTSYDRLLDSITVSITPSSTTSSNIDIGVKSTVDEATQPIATSFSTTDSGTAALPAVDSTTLVESGTSALIASFLAQLTSCYALPLTSRVTGSGLTASDISAPECKAAFYLNDPREFKTNGYVVKKGEAFNGLFVAGGTGVVFSQGTYEFTRLNGDIVAGYKSRDPNGNETFDTFVLRKDTDGKLKLIGNQYKYPGGVVAYQQLRQFITLDQSANNYYSSGFTLNVDNVLVSGSSIFSKVVVTAPDANRTQLVLKPQSGSSFLTLARGDGSSSGTSFVRLARAYVNGAAGDPAAVDSRLFFSPTSYTDEAIQAIPAQSSWKFEYFLAGNSTATPDETQYYKTRSRPMTIAELKARGFASMTAETVAAVSSAADASTGTLKFLTNGTLAIEGPGGTNAWTVGTGQLPPTQVTAFGLSPTSRGFNDSIKFGSTLRKITVPCSPGGGGDDHCYLTGPSYAAGSAINGVHLWARDIAGREFANFYAMYKLN